MVAAGGLENLRNSLSPLSHFQQMITKLSLHRALHFIQGRAEYHLVEFRHHLAAAEGAQFTTAAAGRAGGVLFGQGGEVFTGGDFVFQLLAFGFGADEDVAGGSLSHGFSLYFVALGRVKRVMITEPRGDALIPPGWPEAIVHPAPAGRQTGVGSPG